MGLRARWLSWLAVAVYVAWAYLYVDRTSFVVDGHRIYCLWDDAMVSMRYAKNLADGHGLVWNPGERVQGFSNLGVTLIMYAIHLLVADVTRTSLYFQFVCIGVLVGCVVYVHEIARILFDDVITARVAALLTMSCGSIAVLTLQGTDVGFATLLMLAALHLVVRAERGGKSWPLLAFVPLALGVLVRLDGAVIYAVFIGASFVFSKDRRPPTVGAVILAVTLAAMLGFGFIYYGDALPNTYYLKATGSPLSLRIMSGLEQQAVLIGHYSVVLLFTVVTTITFFRRDRAVLLVVALVAVTALYNVWVGGDWIYEMTSRFFAPALPLYILLFAGGARKFFSSVAIADGDSVRRPTEQRRVDLFVYLSIIAIPTFSTPDGMKDWLSPDRAPMHLQDNIDNYKLARYVATQTASDTTIALHFAGVPAYFSDHESIDVLGKCDRHIAMLKVPRFVPGHSKWDWNYIVNDRRPDILDYAPPDLIALPDFAAAYDAVRVSDEPFAVTSPDGPFFYLRKSSRGKLNDAAAKISAP